MEDLAQSADRINFIVLLTKSGASLLFFFAPPRCKQRFVPHEEKASEITKGYTELFSQRAKGVAPRAWAGLLGPGDPRLTGQL